MKVEHKFIFIIFGASGDLTKRKLIPALFKLYTGKLLDENQFIVLGVSRTEMTDNQFRKKIVISDFLHSTGSESELVEKFSKMTYYLPLNTSNIESYKKLKEKLERLCKDHQLPHNYLFYLSTPPSLFEIISRGLSKFNLNNQKGGTFKRLIIEKPFGYDLKSS